jgi:outer membrane protein assembly factor BamB
LGLILATATPAHAAAVGVVPILIGPIQVLLAVLPYLLVAIGGAFLALFRLSTLKLLAKILWRNKVAFGIVVAAVAGGMYALSRASSSPAPATAPAGSIAGGQWSAFNGGPDRRGFVPGSTEPAAGGVVWKFAPPKGTRFFSSPAIVGSRVYATSAMKETFDDSGVIFCLDADTGAVIWQHDADGFRATYSSPVVGEGCLISGEGLHETRDGRITCLSADTGAKKWELRADSHVESSACIYQGKAYIGCGDDGLYCLALEGDGQGGPKVVFHLDSKQYPDCESCPIAADGKVFFGLGEDGSAVCCVDAASGKEVWKVPAPHPVFSAPCLSGGRLFVGMGNGDMVNSATELLNKRLAQLRRDGASDDEIAKARKEFGPAGAVWCMDPATGNVLWKFPLGETVLGGVAVADGRVYFGVRDGGMYCLDAADGKLIRRIDAHSPIITSPVVAESFVYFVTVDGGLCGLDRKTLAPVWETSIDGGKYFISSPAVGRGHLYIGTDGNGLLCLGQPGAPKKAVWGGDYGGPGQSGWDGSPIPEKAKVLWQYPAPVAQPPSAVQAPGATAAASAAVSSASQPTHESASKPATQECTITAPPAWLDGALYVAVDSKERTGLAKVMPPAGKGEEPKEVWFHPTRHSIWISAGVCGSRVFVADGEANLCGNTRHLQCLDAARGGLVWQVPIDERASGKFVVTEDSIFVFNAADTLTCISTDSPDGKPIWTAKVAAPVGAPSAAAGLVLVANASPPSVIALDVTNGAARWIHSIESTPRAQWESSPEDDPLLGLAATADMAGVFVNGDLLVLSMDNGAVVSAPRGRNGRSEFDGGHRALVWQGAQLWGIESGVKSEFTLFCLDCRTREVRGFPTYRTYPLPAHSLICGQGMIWTWGLDLYLQPVLESGHKYVVTLPSVVWAGMIQIDSRVYVSTINTGLLCIGRGDE